MVHMYISKDRNTFIIVHMNETISIQSAVVGFMAVEIGFIAGESRIRETIYWDFFAPLENFARI